VGERLAKRAVLIFTVLLACVIIVPSAYAVESSNIRGESSVFTVIGPEAMNYLADGICSITNNMDGTVKKLAVKPQHTQMLMLFR